MCNVRIMWLLTHKYDHILHTTGKHHKSYKMCTYTIHRYIIRRHMSNQKTGNKTQTHTHTHQDSQIEEIKSSPLNKNELNEYKHILVLGRYAVVASTGVLYVLLHAAVHTTTVRVYPMHTFLRILICILL